MNKVILIGNLTKDPELTTTTSGLSLCRFTIAVKRNFANADGEFESDFLNVMAWRTLADNCKKYLQKGSKTSVCGRLQNRSYEAQDGSKRTITEVVAEEVEFLTAKTQEKKKEQEDDFVPVDDDDLPF